VAVGEDKKSDTDKVKGTWDRSSRHSVDGKDLPEADLKGLTITFDGEKFTVKMGDQVLQAGTQKMDGSKKPAEVDSKVTEGPHTGNTMLGIYELSDDNAEVLLRPPMERSGPVDFKGGAGLMSGTLKKKK